MAKEEFSIINTDYYVELYNTKITNNSNDNLKLTEDELVGMFLDDCEEETDCLIEEIIASYFTPTKEDSENSITQYIAYVSACLLAETVLPIDENYYLSAYMRSVDSTSDMTTDYEIFTGYLLANNSASSMQGDEFDSVDAVISDYKVTRTVALISKALILSF